VDHALSPDEPTFRQLLGRFASGITVISGLDRGTPVGFTCQSFYSVSVDPPLVSFSASASSTSYPLIRRHGRFTVSVLGHDQQWIGERLARSGPEKWSGISWHASPTGTPLVCNALAWLDCAVVAEHPAGDHTIVVGRVEHLDSERPGADPLVYFRGGYRELAAPAPPSGPRAWPAAEPARDHREGPVDHVLARVR